MIQLSLILNYYNIKRISDFVINKIINPNYNYQNRSLLSFRKMFLMQPCPTVIDAVQLQPMGELKSLIPEFNEARKLIKKFSNTEKLIEMVQNGEVIMQHKIKFDQYLKSQVDLMKTYVATNTVIPFKYNGFFSQKQVGPLLTIKQQWGLEIIMSRYILSSVYIGGALQSIGKLFEQTTNSYNPQYPNTADFSKHLQILFKYFTESVGPLKRLYGVIDHVSKLFSPSRFVEFPETNPEVFKFYTEVMMSNLAYVKLEKYRILKEYKSCKQGAWAVYQKMKELKVRFTRFSEQFQLPSAIGNFINLSIVFYKASALNFMLHENEQKKVEEEYGFIKKQFQQMILQNVVLADEILKLQSIAKKLPGQQQDNVIFANMVLEMMAKHAQSTKYKFEFDIHENKTQKPTIEQIVAQIQIKNIWNMLDQF